MWASGMAMTGLTTALLGQACRTFLAKAYPGGRPTIPLAKRAFLDLAPDQPLEPLLAPPICETLRTPAGACRGYAFRLGSAIYPHLKLQAVTTDDGATWIFAVDTHDALQLDPSHPDAIGWGRLQVANRQLKEQIEQIWEAQGLLTFNGLLRRELEQS
jgi:hypothetical protein